MPSSRTKPLIGTLRNLSSPGANYYEGAWLFNEQSGNNVRNLITRTDHSHSAAWTSGPWGPALLFSGSQRVIVDDPGHFSDSPAGTIVAWVEFNSFSASEVNAIWTIGGDNNGVTYPGLFRFSAREISGGQYIELLCRTEDSSSNLDHWRSADLGTFGGTGWHHLACSSDGSTWRIYLDGVEITNAGSFPSGGNNGKWFSDVGSPAGEETNVGMTYYNGSYVHQHDGKIDSVLAFDRALSADNIRELYEDQYRDFREKTTVTIYKPVAAVTIVPAAAAHAHTADATTISQGHVLATAAADHAHTADATTISQGHVLTTAAADHAHTADATTISQGHVLATAAVDHAHTADATTITQVHTIVSADSDHAHTADNTTVDTATQLLVNDSDHAHLAGATTITQVHTIVSAAADHAHTADATTISQGHVLATAAVDHAHTAGNTTVDTSTQLSVAAAAHAHTADATTISQGHVLATAAADHAHTADATTITQTQTLVVAAAAHAHAVTATTIAFGGFVGPGTVTLSVTYAALSLAVSYATVTLAITPDTRTGTMATIEMWRGQSFVLVGTFRDTADQLYDPAEVYVAVKDPTGAVTTYSYADGEVTKNSTGVYQCVISTATAPGTWSVTMYSNDETPEKVAASRERIHVCEVDAVAEVYVETRPPVIDSGQSFNLDAGSSSGTSVGTPTATAYRGSLQSWTITAGNGDGKFAINASTGEITTAGVLPLSGGSYTLTLRVSDGFLDSDLVNVDVTLTNAWQSTATVTITNSTGGVLTNHPVKATVTFAAGMAADFADIRFTSTDLDTLYAHWIEQYTASTSATVWILVPSLPTGDTTLTLHYDQSSAEDASDGESVFPLLFDDFRNASAAAVTIDSAASIERDSTNPVIPVGSASESDYRIREIGNILDEGAGYSPATHRYKMVYTGYKTGVTTDEKVHGAFSADGVTWTKYASNPFIAARLEDPYVVKDGSTYYLFAENKQGGGTKIICYTSTDFETWAEINVGDGSGNVLSPAAPGQWDDYGVASPTVWYDDTAGKWYMLYEGTQVSNYIPGSVGLAEAASLGGVFTRTQSDPVFEGTDTASDWCYKTVVPDDIVKVDSTYYMSYHGTAYTTDARETEGGLASSTDLLSWTDNANSPFVDQHGQSLTSWQFIDSATVMYYFNVAGGTPDTGGIYRGTLRGQETIDSAKWDTDTRGAGASPAVVRSNGTAKLRAHRSLISSAQLRSKDTFANGVAFGVRWRIKNNYYYTVSFGAGSIVDAQGGSANWHQTVQASGYWWYGYNGNNNSLREQPASGPVGGAMNGTFDAGSIGNFELHEFRYDASGNLAWYQDGVQKNTASDTTFLSDAKKLMISQGAHTTDYRGAIAYVDFVYARPMVASEPVVVIT